jgi:hypothetical protein
VRARLLSSAMAAIRLRSLLRLVLQGWREEVLKLKVLFLTGLLAKYRKEEAKKSNSIWSMRKEALAQTAVEELNITMDQAMAMRVPELRLALKENREDLKAVTDQLPANLTRLKKEDLQEECRRRGIDTKDPRNGKDKVRDKMIMEIRADHLLKRQAEGQCISTLEMDLEQEEWLMTTCFPDLLPDGSGSGQGSSSTGATAASAGQAGEQQERSLRLAAELDNFLWTSSAKQQAALRMMLDTRVAKPASQGLKN